MQLCTRKKSLNSEVPAELCAAMAMGETASKETNIRGRNSDYALLPDSTQDPAKDVYATPLMSADEICKRTQEVWHRFFSLRAIWRRSACTPTMRARLAFISISKLYRQMYADTGLATESARQKKAKIAARFTARQCRKLFQSKPMPELQSATWELAQHNPTRYLVPLSGAITSGKETSFRVMSELSTREQAVQPGSRTSQEFIK